MVLPLERLAAHRARVLPLVAVRQLVLRERRCVVKHLPADLRQRNSGVSNSVDENYKLRYLSNCGGA